MKHILFSKDAENLKVAILIKGNAMNKGKLESFYVTPCQGVAIDEFVAIDLLADAKGKCPAKVAKPHIDDILPVIEDMGINTVLVCDPNYFKFLTKKTKVDGCYGYVTPCAYEDYEHLGIVLCPNYQAIAYNPALSVKVERALEAVSGNVAGQYVEPGKGITHSSYYPDKVQTIGLALEQLMEYPELTCDIEGLSLEFWKCGISSIAFAWDQHNGLAFGVERGPEPLEYAYQGLSAPEQPMPFWRNVQDIVQIKQMLMSFFLTYKGKLTFHNIAFDAKVLVHELFMRSLDDYSGMIDGIKAMTWNFDDTKLIAYMATNNAVQNELGLKPLSAEFTGDYGEDLKDTRLIPYDRLLKYNLKDCLATWFVKNKYKPIMVADEQEEIYEGLMKDSTITLLQTELCGMPIDPDKVQEAKAELTAIVNECNTFFAGSDLIKTFHMGELISLAAEKTAKAKKKIYAVNDPTVARFVFNPGSDTQLRKLLFDYLGYPVLDLTKGKQPSCSGKTLKKLLKGHTEPLLKKLGWSIDKDGVEHYVSTPDIEMGREHRFMFKYLLKLADASIILSTFIPAFENAQQLPDGSYRLYGNFNAAGTQSLRLSSSAPNLMNLPSGSVFAKLVKKCFEPIAGWLFGGSDFAALEDRTGALLTRDPARLKIYTEGYDGHSMRAQYYWPEKMSDIDPSDVDSINSIAKKYKSLRQDSKAPSFALQYSGTYITLMKNCGFSEEDAKAIEVNYHKLYTVSDEWLAGIIEQAKVDGYVTMAFGARIRTPLLAKTVGEGRHVPYAAQAEGRSAGNAATQSYCALTLRAFNEFMRRVWASPYKLDILPAATIHDSIYLLFRDSCAITEWVNINLVECMLWDGLPELYHPVVKMGAELEIYWPNWASDCTLPNNATKEQIREITSDHLKKMQQV